MKTKLNYLLILIILTILNSCERSLPKQDDFIGKWVSEDGAIIILNKDGTCILENVDYYKINSFLQNRDEKLYVKGKWDFIKDIESGIIDGLDYGINITYHLPQQNIKGEITFYSIYREKVWGQILPLGVFLYGMEILMK